MTERLYYRDPTLLTFTARVVAVTAKEGVHHTVLDRSAFYPASGGQLSDSGKLNDIDVVDVVEFEDGEVLHVTTTPVGNIGLEVTGVVDKDRRNRHRQQHTAQHILSQAFIQVKGFETVSVHLGEEYGTVELNTGAIVDAELGAVEKLANQIIADNLRVEILFIDASEAASTPLRKIPDREGEIRVIKIGDFDWSACGGTHCLSTAEVGLIKLTAIEKLRGHVVVRFLAGVQAFEDYRMRFAATDALARTLTCHPGDLPAKLDKLMAENKAQRRDLAMLQKEMLPIYAERYADDVKTINGHPVVSAVIAGLDGGLAATLAQLISDRIHGLAILESDGRLILAVASGSSLHAGNIVKQMAVLEGLKGGGSERVAQLGGISVGMLDHYRDCIMGIVGNA